jgi:hypothetical protein
LIVKTYSHNTGQDTDVRKRVLGGQLDLSGLHGAAAVLPAGVLGAQFLGEVLGVAHRVLAKKISAKNWSKMKTCEIAQGEVSSNVFSCA